MSSPSPQPLPSKGPLSFPFLCQPAPPPRPDYFLIEIKTPKVAPPVPEFAPWQDRLLTPTFPHCPESHY